MDLPTLQSIKDASAVFREAINAVKDAKALLPSPRQDAVTATIEKASTSAAMAEVEIAKALGYRLCQMHVPAADHVAYAPVTVVECPRCHSHEIVKLGGWLHSCKLRGDLTESFF
jgi:hypothetical protein